MASFYTDLILMFQKELAQKIIGNLKAKIMEGYQFLPDIV